MVPFTVATFSDTLEGLDGNNKPTSTLQSGLWVVSFTTHHAHTWGSFASAFSRALSVRTPNSPRIVEMKKATLSFRICGSLCLVWFSPPSVSGLDPQYGFSYQRIEVDLSKTRESAPTGVGKYNEMLPTSSGTYPQCVSHGAMKFVREYILARTGTRLRSPRLVSERRGSRRGLAD